ncbi:MAG: acyltransferase [Mycobacteriales bacterium]
MTAQVVPLAGEVGPDELAALADRLDREPGLGAVVLGDRAVVGHARLLRWVPRETGQDDALWLLRLTSRLEAKGYVVERQDRVPELRRRLPLLRTAARRGRSLVRTPLRVRVLRSRNRLRRRRFLVRLRWEAWLVGAPLVLDVSRDLVVEPGVRLQVRPQGATLRIGPRCSIASGVVLRLGGELVLARNVELRHDVALNVKGRLELQGRNNLGRGTMVHADSAVVLAWGACTSEYVTLLDSHHEYDGSLVHVHDQGIDAAPVTLGAGTLVGAKATVLPGVTIGRSCLVGASSVVTRDVPDGWVVAGAPARQLRPVAGP